MILGQHAVLKSFQDRPFDFRTDHLILGQTIYADMYVHMTNYYDHLPHGVEVQYKQVPALPGEATNRVIAAPIGSVGILKNKKIIQ